MYIYIYITHRYQYNGTSNRQNLMWRPGGHHSVRLGQSVNIQRTMRNWSSTRLDLECRRELPCVFDEFSALAGLYKSQWNTWCPSSVALLAGCVLWAVLSPVDFNDEQRFWKCLLGRLEKLPSKHCLPTWISYVLARLLYCTGSCGVAVRHCLQGWVLCGRVESCRAFQLLVFLLQGATILFRRNSFEAWSQVWFCYGPLDGYVYTSRKTLRPVSLPEALGETVPRVWNSVQATAVPWKLPWRPSRCKKWKPSYSE